MCSVAPVSAGRRHPSHGKEGLGTECAGRLHQLSETVWAPLCLVGTSVSHYELAVGTPSHDCH